MKARSVAAAACVALAVAAGLPAFNWAQDATSESISEDVEVQPEWSEPQEESERPERPERPERAEGPVRVESDEQAARREQAWMLRDQAKAMRDQEVVIRKAVEHATSQAAKQVAEAQKEMQKAIIHAKSGQKFNFMFAGREGSPPLQIKIREAASAVRNAEDDDAREKATEELASALDEYFEQDMEARTKEVEEIQARVERLQAQLDRRREKKAEIIDLQLKVALNEADGLGFYSEPKDMMFNFQVPPPPMMMPMSGDTYGIMTPQHPVMAAPPAPPVPAASPAPAPKPRR